MAVACSRCGAILDAPREDPRSGRLARKCAQCLAWHPLSSEEALVELLRRRALARGRKVA